MISSLAFVLSFIVHAESPLPKSGEFKVKGVGRARVTFETVGEPISQPERIEVLVTCQKTKSPKRVGVFRACRYEGYSYEEGPKVVSVTMYYGRVDSKTGDVTCDQFDIQHVELKEACR